MAANNPDTLFKMLTHDIQNVNIVHWMRHGFRGDLPYGMVDTFIFAWGRGAKP